ncbi:Phosphatidylinositol-4-phosphate-5-kinase, partial [Globisporangium splendens]
MESVVEEAFEVQALQPFHGWTFERFTDRSGNTFPALTHAAAQVLARDDKLNGIADQLPGDGDDDSSSSLEIGVLPSSEWMWSHLWMPDVEYTQCDEEGWSYGLTIARMNRRLAEGSSKTKREYYHFVRRRRWIRTRVRKPPAPTTCASSESDSDSDAEEISRRSDTLSTKRYYRVYRDSLMSYFQFRSTLSQLANFEKVQFTDDDIQKEGWLGVRGRFSRSWKLRYFLLRLDRSSLVCLRDRASLVQIYEEPINRHTSAIVEESTNPQQLQFLVINGDRQIRLNAVDVQTRSAWLTAISELIVRSRASFFAGDESEGNTSTRSRTFRRLRNASLLTDDDAGSASGYFPKNGGANSHHGGAGGTRKTRRKAWRPYKLVSATMHYRPDTDRLRRYEYFERFRKDIRKRIGEVASLVSSNIDILEENLEAAEQLLSSAVVSVPTRDIEQLRVDTNELLREFEEKVNATLDSEYSDVLSCNGLSRDLYLLAKRLNELILSFAPPAAQATIKKVIIESPTKRRIPEDWFTEPKDYEKKPSTVNIQNDGGVKVVSSQSATAGKAESLSSFISKSSSQDLKWTNSRRSVAESSRVSTTSNAISGAEPIKIRPYVELPPTLCEGHFDLPAGVNDFAVKVHDKDLGSLIGFTLCSKAYVEELESHYGNSVNIAKELVAEKRNLVRCDPSTSTNSFIWNRLPSEKRNRYLDKMRSNDVQHTDMKFSYESSGSSHSIRCVAFFAAQFHALRALTEPGNLQFLNSIAESRRWDTTGGKSGAFFSLSHDKRYVLKGISLTEFNMFLHMAPHYFKFLSHVVVSQNPTVMTKILGLFKLSHSRRLHKQTTYVVVMENLAYGCSPGQMYDIKGILRRRHDMSDSEGEQDRDTFADDSGGMMKGQVAFELPVLLDGNLAERIPIPVYQSDLDVIESAIQNDTSFLCRAGVIDYSILMLFDEERREVVLGLIDYLHQFDFLKKMESTSKASLTFRNPTVISPVSYRRRFVNAMHRYLVGIEQELELRMRKRTLVTSKTKQQMQKMLLADASKSEQSDKSADTSATNTNMSSTRGVHGSSSPGTTGSGRTIVATTLSGSRQRGTKSDGEQLEFVVPRSRGTSLSHVTLVNGTVTAFDHNGCKAHSDGEEFSSTSSDENCIKSSLSVIGSMMHQRPELGR